MFRLVVLSCAVALSSAQFVDPSAAKILKEQRFNAGDGRAGSAFATEDGAVFREETNLSGERVGQYSYVGDDGQTYTVKYTAGKDGFRILDGSHVPNGANGLNAAAFDPAVAAAEIEQPIQPVQRVAQPQPRPQPRPQPQQIQIQPQQIAQPKFADVDYDDTPVDPNRNPFINPHDPTHRDFQFNSNAARFDPLNPNTVQQNLVPACAGCEGVNPFINPFDETHKQAGLLAGHLAGHRTAPRPAPRRQPAPQQIQIPVTAAPRRQIPQFIQNTTPSTRNFFPPGKLALNRFETGFNFDFES